MIAALLAAPALAGDLGEWGDAPENVIAYPSLGVFGAFPTCQNTGPATWIYHGALCWANFGGAFDFETEGNAGLCSSFNPYDADECCADGDAGLIMPPAYTIDATGTVVPCVNHGSLGAFCTTANWGQNVDITVINNMPVIGYVNVLMDFDQNGMWGGASQCPGGAMAPEHVLVDWPVPMNFAGPLSALGPPSFLIGPNLGYVWTRFSVTEQPVGGGWDGSGGFEDGETEDYLLQIDDGTPVEESSWGVIKSLYR